MSQIRSEILYTRKVNEIRECDNEMQRLHIAVPIASDDEDSNKETDNNELIYIDNESDIQVSDNEDEINFRSNTNDNDNIDIENDAINDEDINSEEQRWVQLIEDWIELGNRENKFDDIDDQIFLSTEWDSDFNFGGREIHPADDNNAKWNLNTLLESTLDSPAFLGSDEIFTDAY
jgi:hypothetical protein